MQNLMACHTETAWLTNRIFSTLYDCCAKIVIFVESLPEFFLFFARGYISFFEGIYRRD